MPRKSKAQVRREYEQRLAEHPKVKALSRQIPRPRGRRRLKRGVPKLIAEAMQDKDLAAAIMATRRVMRYHRRVGEIAQRRIRRKRIPLKEQIALIRQGENVEHDFREMFRLAVRAARSNPAIQAYAAAVASRPDDTQVIDDLPSFLSRQELAAIKYLGVEPQEVNETWDTLFRPRRQQVLELMASGKINQRLRALEKSAKRLEFPESPRYLVKRDVITLCGDGGAPDPVVAFLTVVVCVVAGPIIVATAAAVAASALGMALAIAPILLPLLPIGGGQHYPWGLTPLNRQEFWLSIGHPADAARVAECANEAFSLTSAKYEGQFEDFEDNEADAFRHAWWNCCMARAIGADLAKRFGDAHEYCTVETPAGKMDLHNNQVGRDLAVNPTGILDSNWEGKSCEELVDEAIRQGMLVTSC